MYDNVLTAQLRADRNPFVRGEGMSRSEAIVRRIASIFLVLGMLLSSGCARRMEVSWPCLGSPECELEQVVPRTIVPVVELSTAYPGTEKPALAAQSLNWLTAPDCQYRAAAAATTADMIELEKAVAAALTCCETRKASCAMRLANDLLAIRADKKRNTAAANALEAFYRLAEVHGRDQQLGQSIAEVTVATTRMTRLHREGLLPDVNRHAMETKRLTLLDARASLSLARQQLNGQLHAILGCSGRQSEGYWPEVDWRLVPITVDVEAEIARGLCERHNLRALRLVLKRLDIITLPVARGVLQMADASLGSITQPKRCLPAFSCRGADCEELLVREEQFLYLLTASEEAAATEIRSAAIQLETEYRRAILAQQSLDVCQARLDARVKKRDVTDTTWLDVTKAKLKVINATSSLIERIAAVHLAQVRLYRVQGVLTEQCGS